MILLSADSFCMKELLHRTERSLKINDLINDRKNDLIKDLINDRKNDRKINYWKSSGK